MGGWSCTDLEGKAITGGRFQAFGERPGTKEAHCSEPPFGDDGAAMTFGPLIEANEQGCMQAF